MKKSLKKIIIFILILLIVVSATYIIKYYFDLNNAQAQTHLLNEIQTENSITVDTENTTNSDETQKTDRMIQIDELKKENNEIVGWIEIENTNINYPVLQGTDNDFYMDHNYKKEYSMAGAIFLDKSYSWIRPSDNLLIFGHNMKNGTMFENLLNYRNQNYYFEHPNIRFTTSTEDSIYEIISVFPSRTYYKNEQNVFRYYYFINAENENEFNDFVNNAKKSSLYDTGKTAVYGDTLITLSTCSYHTDDGRFVVVARKSKE